MRNPRASDKTKLKSEKARTLGAFERVDVIGINAHIAGWMGAAMFPASLVFFALQQNALAIATALVASVMVSGLAVLRAKGTKCALMFQIANICMCALLGATFIAPSIFAALALVGLSVFLTRIEGANGVEKIVGALISISVLALAATQIGPLSIAMEPGWAQSASAMFYILGFGQLVVPLFYSKGGVLSREEEQIKTFRYLVESVRDAVIKYGADGKIVYLSHTAEKLFGCKRYELMGAGFVERMHLLDRPYYLKALSEVTHMHTSKTLDVRMCCDGEQGNKFVWLEVALNPVSERTDEIGRAEIIGILRDVTERKQQEKEIEEAKKLAETANEAKSRFLATIGHELRTPLNAIVGFSDMMLNNIGGELSKDHREYAELVRGSGAHLLDTVSMLLDMSKLEAGKFELQTGEITPGDLAEPCFAIVKSDADQKGVKLVADISHALPSMVADERACRQVLINLLSNAVKFSKAGDEVKLSIRRYGKKIHFSVKDNGIGISKADIERLGEPFFQAQSGLNRQYEGTGLGLSIVQGLVELHEGKLSIHSKVGVGTTMSVALPIDGPNAEAHENVLEELSDRRFVEEEQGIHKFEQKQVG